ncbi:Verru_Chthon cassette protein B [Verrucomicrobium sp. GAS474]|uniref:Verru_Chthon cassette protein B n=1 Tax=Verrucomicrobium sp. GAS474 TaxID=1882831 RepID=UPI00087BB4C6|nr:Verru_Chthon cassette protein B [Verrucomicrobium sp. GAS474]SDT99065.1 Verru_Chthon cassette protein B [Verrucomicrobium sp. GAS474]
MPARAAGLRNAALLAKASAFSLVEVVLALGVVSVGFVAVMGLMPVGLKTMRQATTLTVQSQIVQQLVGTAETTPFPKLAAKFDNAKFYYDDEGGSLTNAVGKTRYWVTTTVTDPIYPGSDQVDKANPLSQNLRLVRIQVINSPIAPTSGGVGQVTNVFFIQVASSEK